MVLVRLAFATAAVTALAVAPASACMFMKTTETMTPAVTAELAPPAETMTSATTGEPAAPEFKTHATTTPAILPTAPKTEPALEQAAAAK